MDIKPKISVIIPYMEADPGKPSILKRWTDSIPHVDELIISSNWKEGYAKPINRGLKLAKGDFLLVSNDDLIWDYGDIYNLCKPGIVTSPMINGQSQDFWGCCFMIPREVYETVGGLYEGYEISYYDDDDYLCTLYKNGIKTRGVQTINVMHPEGGRTLHTFDDHDSFSNRNRAKFVERWGHEPGVIYTYYQEHGILPGKDENISNNTNH